MVGLDVRNFPYVGRIFASWISTELPAPGALVVSFARILLRYPNWIKIEDVVLTVAVPKHCLIPAAEATARMSPVTEVPDNSVSEREMI
jgi:hypothetical protein